jgi:hypothetical protein
MAVTVPLDLLVRVRDALEHYRSDLFERGHESDASALVPDIAELTAQIEQQQDSVPAWAWRQASAQYDCDTIAAKMQTLGTVEKLNWIESRALALAQKG